MSFKVVGIGEVLWDLLPSGRQLGGAPANFAYHARALGAEAQVVSRVGRDEPGRELLRRLEQLGLRTDAVELDPTTPTGTVTVEIQAGGQPRFTIHEQVAWDHIAGEAAGRRAVTTAHALCFGTLAQRSAISRQSIGALLKAAPADSLRILDLNLRQSYYSRAIIEESLTLANILKVNDNELERLAEMFDLPGDERGRIAELARRFQLRLVAYTRGNKGSLLHSESHWSEHPGMAVKVVDTVGAGDAFTAAAALGMLARWPMEDINHRANEVAAFVCSQPGGTPELPEQLRALFRAFGVP